MELLGDRNWWLQKWLDRLLPNIAVEGSEGVAAFEFEHQEERERRFGGPLVTKVDQPVE